MENIDLSQIVPLLNEEDNSKVQTVSMNAILKIINKFGIFLAIINLIMLIICTKKNKSKTIWIAWLVWGICIPFGMGNPLMSMSYALDYQPTIWGNLVKILFSVVPVVIQIIIFVYTILTLKKSKRRE